MGHGNLGMELGGGLPEVACMKITILTIEEATVLGHLSPKLPARAQVTYKAPRPKIAQTPNFRRVVRCSCQTYGM